MTTLITRAGKGSPLTNTEMDGNLTGLIANNSGAAEPTTMYAYQWWADTTTGILKQRNAANSAWIDVLTMATGAPLGVAATGTEQGLTQFYYPANGSGFQDLYRSGWLPSWFNQQWGGAQWGTLPDGTFGSVATGNVQDDGSVGIGSAASNYYISSGFKVSENITNPTVWVKLYKVGNPTSSVQMYLYSDTGGSPNAAIGAISTINPKLITSKTDGEWYAFTPTGTLSANTQYHIVMLWGATSGTDYIVWKNTSNRKYPHGSYNSGTSAPVWTPTTTAALCFLVQNPAANSLIQSGGLFDYRLSFNNGSPVNQSRSVAQPLSNFYDGKTCSVLYRGTYAVSTNVWDFCYGLDHDRITLTINASGYPVLTIYESDRTVATVTGTGSVTSGSHDVGIRVRTVGDGADYATLYVDGASVGTPLTSQTFTMDAAMPRLGTARLGDGFGLAPTWTQDMQMGSLPSAQGWTWTGTATEANAMSIQGGKLYQNANGYTSTQTGYYAKTTGFVNATGWVVATKVRSPSNTNGTGKYGCVLWVYDGTKGVEVYIQEYFVQIGYGGTADFTIQGDFKLQDHVFTLCGKGSDYYLLIDGKLAVDGTGKLTNATATNQVVFGDATIAAGENADAIWSYVKYYQGGMIMPTAGSNTCSEFAHWSGDKSALFPSLYNSGTPVSVKQLCGVPRNYQFEQVVQREVRRGVTSNPTSTATSPALVTDMESYSIGASLNVTGAVNIRSSAGTTERASTFIDGRKVYEAQFITTGVQDQVIAHLPNIQYTPLGLHKIELKADMDAGTATYLQSRALNVEAKS